MVAVRTSLFLAFGAALARRPCHWGPEEWKGLVTFGNSYTDDSRLEYFENHNGSAPPVGWNQPVSNDSFSGGYNWGHFAAQNASVKRFNYAVSGAVCSNEISPREYAPINAPYPSVLEYEIPAYLNDSTYVEPNGTKFFDTGFNETVFAIWIGTNDVGNGAFLTDSQVKGMTIPDYIECVYQALDSVYASGGRYFVIMNLAPLQLTPQYATPENGGLAATGGWPDKGSNITEISYRMLETVVTVNDVYKYKTPFEVWSGRYPGAQFSIFDTFSFMSEIYHNPEAYLESPANVTGYVHHCDRETGDCERLPNEHAYMWYDELHPSEKTDEAIGLEFVNVVRGDSKWATYW